MWYYIEVFLHKKKQITSKNTQHLISFDMKKFDSEVIKLNNIH